MALLEEVGEPQLQAWITERRSDTAATPPSAGSPVMVTPTLPVFLLYMSLLFAPCDRLLRVFRAPRTRETVVPQFWPLGRALWAGDQKAMVSAVLAISSLRQELGNGFLLQLAADTKRVSADRQHLVRQCSRELLSTDQWSALYNSIPRLVKLVIEYITNLHTKGRNVSRDALWYRPRVCVLFGIIMNCVNKDCIFIQSLLGCLFKNEFVSNEVSVFILH